MTDHAKPVEAEKRAISVTTVVYNVLLLVCMIVAIRFIYHVAEMADHFVWSGAQYAAETYQGAIALVICVYIWLKTETGYQRYIAAVLISILIVGAAAWLVGKLGLVGRYYLQSGG
jgi:hypothetical protein